MKSLTLKNLSFAAAFTLHFLMVAIASVYAQSDAKDESGTDAKPMNVLFLISDDLRPEFGLLRRQGNPKSKRRPVSKSRFAFSASVLPASSLLAVANERDDRHATGLDESSQSHDSFS